MTLCWLTAMRAVEQISKAKGGPVLFPWTVGIQRNMRGTAPRVNGCLRKFLCSPTPPQNGRTITMTTMTIIRTVGASFHLR
jgi:hypothetical protein